MLGQEMVISIRSGVLGPSAETLAALLPSETEKNVYS